MATGENVAPGRGENVIVAVQAGWPTRRGTRQHLDGERGWSREADLDRDGGQRSLARRAHTSFKELGPPASVAPI